MPRLRLPARPRFKFALLSAAGAALVLLPLGQVLRFQSAELEALAAERAALDPFGMTLSVQHGLLAHRDAADRVLRGRSTLEQERRLRQAELDERLRRLQDTLSAGWWVRALRESQGLAGDWRQLARRVALRQVNAEQSADGHQLLMEQAVQVMDLIAAQGPASVTRPMLAWGARQQLSPAARHDQLAQLDAWLLQADRALLEREGALKAERATLILAAAALAALGLAGWLQQHRNRPGSPPPGDGVRRGHGRRTTDQAPAAATAAPLIEQLRQGQAPHQSEPR